MHGKGNSDRGGRRVLHVPSDQGDPSDPSDQGDGVDHGNWGGQPRWGTK
jgi:hypothetical protein